MLELPAAPVAAFIRDTASRTNALCDWAEGCIAFGDSEVGQEEIKDSLVREHVVSDSETAEIVVRDVWEELGRRARILGATSHFKILNRKLESSLEWKSNPAYAFCLYLSLENFYRKPKKLRQEREYGQQGRLFEALAYESLTGWGWAAERVGWSPRHAIRLRELLPGLTTKLGEEGATDLDFHIPTCANDGGLDLVLHRDFPDGWGARPVILFQCASGWSTWESKLGTPHPNLWDKLVRFPWPPMTGLIIPFALTKKGLYQVSEVQAGVVIDRLRLLGAGVRKRDDFSLELNRELVTWLRPRITKLKDFSA